jgi:hypothetical protein
MSASWVEELSAILLDFKMEVPDFLSFLQPLLSEHHPLVNHGKLLGTL